MTRVALGSWESFPSHSGRDGGGSPATSDPASIRKIIGNGRMTAFYHGMQSDAGMRRGRHWRGQERFSVPDPTEFPLLSNQLHCRKPIPTSAGHHGKSSQAQSLKWPFTNTLNNFLCTLQATSDKNCSKFFENTSGTVSAGGNTRVAGGKWNGYNCVHGTR